MEEPLSEFGFPPVRARFAMRYEDRRVCRWCRRGPIRRVLASTLMSPQRRAGSSWLHPQYYAEAVVRYTPGVELNSDRTSPRTSLVLRFKVSGSSASTFKRSRGCVLDGRRLNHQSEN